MERTIPGQVSQKEKQKRQEGQNNAKNSFLLSLPYFALLASLFRLRHIPIARPLRRIEFSLFFTFMIMISAMALVVAQAQNNEAELFDLSSGHNESCVSFTPDGKTAYFQKGIAWSGISVIVFSNFRDNGWTEPEVASFSGRYRDNTPFITPDGKRLFFSSSRSFDGKSSKNDLDIWFVEKTANGWGEPQNLGLPINTADQETSPSVAADGTLYFASNRAGARGGADIYRARLVDGKYTEPENLEAINSPEYDSNPCVDARGERLFFASSRPGGAGAMDIYVSALRGGRWEAPRNVGSAVNTPAAELWTALSPDGRYLFFNSSRKVGDPAFERKPLTYPQLIKKLRSPGNGSTDIYRIELGALKFDQ
jgi:Tol biopolymer transport system component